MQSRQVNILDGASSLQDFVLYSPRWLGHLVPVTTATMSLLNEKKLPASCCVASSMGAIHEGGCQHWRPEQTLDPREAERRFDAPEVRLVGRWPERPFEPDPSVVARETWEIIDTYFDTEYWRTYRAGYALRESVARKAPAGTGLRGGRDVARQDDLTKARRTIGRIKSKRRKKVRRS